MGERQNSTYCGIGIRGIAIGIDSIVWILLFIAAMFAVGASTGQLEFGANQVNTDLQGTSAGYALVLWMGLTLGYHTILEWRYGKTLGKKLVDIRVTGSNGSTPSFTSSLIRNVVRIVDWLPGFYLFGIVGMAVSEKNKRLGDKIAGTAVVR